MLAEAPSLVAGYDDATELVPHGQAAVGVREALSTAIRPRLPAAARRLDRLLAAERSPASALRIAEDAVRDIETGSLAPWCRNPDAKARCVALALETSELARSLNANACVAHALVARAELAEGGVEGALTGLERATETVDDRVPCLEILAVLARKAGDTSRFERVLDGLGRSACRSNQECSQTARWVSAEEEAVGQLQRALAACRRGHERVPEDVDLLECTARLAARAGLHAEAAEDYAELVRRRPDEGKWRDAEVAERSAAIRGVVGGR